MSFLKNALPPTILVLALAAIVTLAPSIPAATEPSSNIAPADPVVTITNASQVYYPTRVKKGAKFKKPAVLTTSTIFDSIPEWKEIKKKKLTKKDAEYHLLLKKANDKFNSALTTVQSAGSYDIIAEEGAITVKGGKATDVNKDVVNALP